MGETILDTSSNRVGKNKRFMVLEVEKLRDSKYSIEDKIVSAYDGQILPYSYSKNTASFDLDLSDSAITRARLHNIKNEKDFFVIDPECFKEEGFDIIDSLFYARVISFDGGYNETLTDCANFFNVSKQKISDARAKLILLGKIEVFEDNGIIFLRKKVKQEEKKIIPHQYNESVKVFITASEDESETRTTRKNKDFTIKYKDYMDAWDKGVDTVKYLQLPYNSKPELQKSFAGLVSRYSEVKPEDFNESLLRYYDYLMSSTYAYQLEKNKFCPRLTKATDIFDKFKQIAEFKNNPDRQYDPSKVLTFGG